MSQDYAKSCQDDVISLRAMWRDRGAGFIEVLVSVVLLGTAGVAVLTAVGAAASGAATQRDVADAQAVVSAAADEVAAGSIPFVPCAGPADYADLLPSDAVTVDRVEFWDASVWTPTTDVGCDPATDTLQLITLEAVGRRGAASIQVVKRLATDPDADFVVNQGSGSGNGAPIVPSQPTPGIDGTSSTTTAPTTTSTTTSTTSTTSPPAGSTTTSTTTTTVPATTTTTTTTTLPGPRPTCEVTSIVVNKWWQDTIQVQVTNASTHTYAWDTWFVRLGYDGSGAEQNGHYTSTWSEERLTLTPAQSWISLSTGTRGISIVEPGGTLKGLKTWKVACEVVTS